MISKLGKDLLGLDFNCQQATKFKRTNLPLNLPNTLLRDAAIEISRSIEYYLSPPHKTAGSFFVIISLKNAYENLPNGSAEKEWLSAMMMHLASNGGLLFSTGLLSQGAQ